MALSHSSEPTRLTCMSYDPSRLYVTAMVISSWNEGEIEEKKKRKHYVTTEMAAIQRKDSILTPTDAMLLLAKSLGSVQMDWQSFLF